MANVISDTLYRVALDSERTYVYVSAKDKTELIDFLAKEYAGKHEVYGVKEVGRDGSLSTVTVITDERYQALVKQYDQNQQPFKPVYIDGLPYAVRLPQGGSSPDDYNEWDNIMDKLGDKKDLLHWNGMSSWCQESMKNMEGARLHRGYHTAHSRSYTRGSQRLDVGFRPVFEPLDPKTLKPAPQRLSAIQDGSVFPMGTLYMNDQAVYNPQFTTWPFVKSYTPGAQLQIRDTHPDPEKQIKVVKVGDILIADRNILQTISWDDLNQMGFVYGREEDHERDRKPGLNEIIQEADDRKSVAVEMKTQESRGDER